MDSLIALIEAAQQVSAAVHALEAQPVASSPAQQDMDEGRCGEAILSLDVTGEQLLALERLGAVRDVDTTGSILQSASLVVDRCTILATAALHPASPEYAAAIASGAEEKRARSLRLGPSYGDSLEMFAFLANARDVYCEANREQFAHARRDRSVVDEDDVIKTLERTSDIVVDDIETLDLSGPGIEEDS
jgi:hypothetical protein